MTVTRYAPFALTRFARLEMTPVVFPPAYLGCEVAPMRFTPDDDFYDEDDTAGLSDCAVGLLARAGSWSARKLKNGFVPASMLAQLSSTPAQAAEELCRRGIWRRAKRGGFQFTRWTRWGDLAEDVRQREADTERKREQGRVRSQRKRDRDKEALAAAMQAGVTPPSRGQTAGVTLENCDSPEKQQVNEGGVTRYEARSSRVTRGPSRARARQDDFDFGQSAGVSQSRSDARASDADDPALVSVVASVICAEASFLPDDDQARAVIRIYEDRARKAGTVIRDKPAYYAGSVRKEPDLWNGILLPKPPPAAELRPPAPAPGSWADPFTPRPDPDRPHDFDPIIGGVVCQTCNRTERNPLHATERLA